MGEAGKRRRLAEFRRRAGVRVQQSRRRSLWALLPVLLAAWAAVAQDGPDGEPPWIQALRHGPLVVWVLHPAPPAGDRSKQIPQYRAAKPQYTESTTGGLGQSASSFGQTAGSYGVDAGSSTISVPDGTVNSPTPTDPDHPEAVGYHEQTAGSFGQSAGSFGADASQHGTTTGNLGTSASNVGTNAGDAGTTVGNFGHSLSTIANAGATDAQAAAARARAAARNAPQPPDALRDWLQMQLARAFPAVRARFVTVSAERLSEKLAAVANTEDSPDVLVSETLPAEWRRIAPAAGVKVIGSAGRYEQTGAAAGSSNAGPKVQAAALLSAPHAAAARGYVLWLSDPSLESRFIARYQPVDGSLKNIGDIAAGAVNALLSGTALSGDPAMAVFSAPLAQRLALEGAATDPEDLNTMLVHVSANQRLAVAATVTLVMGRQEEGIVRSLVVLTKGPDGKWGVLQLSVNMPAQALDYALRELTPLTERGTEAHLGTISLTAPVDGDVRSPSPELGWENGGGGSLLAVEWQWKNDGQWSDSRLYFVAEGLERLQTSTEAQFATGTALYRWRVWSLGQGGAVTLSGWRTINVVR